MASDIYTMIGSLKGEKFGPHFKKHFRTRTTCFVLPLTEMGTKRFQFITASGGKFDKNFRY